MTADEFILRLAIDNDYFDDRFSRLLMLLSSALTALFQRWHYLHLHSYMYDKRGESDLATSLHSFDSATKHNTLRTIKYRFQKYEPDELRKWKICLRMLMSVTIAIFVSKLAQNCTLIAQCTVKLEPFLSCLEKLHLALIKQILTFLTETYFLLIHIYM